MHPAENWGGGWVPIYTVGWAEAYLRAKYHLDPFSRLAAINMGRIFLGGEVLRPLPFGEGERGAYLTLSRLGRGLPPYQVAPSTMHPFGRNR